LNLDEQNFQKRLIVLQLLATIIAAVGAILITQGWSLQIFSSQLGIDSIIADNSTKQNLEIFSNIALKNGMVYQFSGYVLLFAIPFLLIMIILKEKIKHKKMKLSKLKILVDEMYDGKDLELIEKGYDAYSVKKLRLEGKSLRYDYSVLNYAKDNSMILITEDPENIGACQENNLPCVGLGQNPSIEDIIKELELLKKAKRD